MIYRGCQAKPSISPFKNNYCSQVVFNSTEMQTAQQTCNTTQIAKLSHQERQFDKASHVQRRYLSP